MDEDFIRADEREKIAAMVDDFSWVLPMYKDKQQNMVSDDAAESVKEQIAKAIRQKLHHLA